jgi:hypothetical protein
MITIKAFGESIDSPTSPWKKYNTKVSFAMNTKIGNTSTATQQGEETERWR